MKPKPLPSQEELKALLDYDPLTGIFTRKHRIKGVKFGSPAGSLKSTGYMAIYVAGASYYSHRLAFVWMGVELSDIVDHIDQNKCNNAWSNLRQSDVSHNTHNSPDRPLPLSGHKLIRMYITTKGNSRYTLAIRPRNGVLPPRQSFKTIEEAIEARDKYTKENPVVFQPGGLTCMILTPQTAQTKI